MKKMSDPGIKRFLPSKFFTCGGLILCVLIIKQISDPEIKRFILCAFKEKIAGIQVVSEYRGGFKFKDRIFFLKILLPEKISFLHI